MPAENVSPQSVKFCMLKFVYVAYLQLLNFKIIEVGLVVL